MQTTFLLLRNNKQTGPYSLDALLQQQLLPHDLVWIEGRSAGWQYPSEIPALSPNFQTVLHETAGPSEPDSIPQRTETLQPNSGLSKNASHIYVCLPAGAFATFETSSGANSLEAKAEALYNRTQAYLAGRDNAEPETRYSRSLTDMKDAYGTWRITQQTKKRRDALRKKSWTVASIVLAIITSSFLLQLWWQNKNPVPVVPAIIEQNRKALLLPSDPLAFAATETRPGIIEATNALEPGRQSVPNLSPSKKANLQAKKSSVVKKALGKTADTALTNIHHTKAENANVVPTDNKAPVLKRPPLSALVSTTAIINDGKHNRTAVVKLINNSSETLKSVTVTMAFLKKNERERSQKTLYFFNVAPGASPVITSEVARRTTGVRAKIHTIARTDGSLYLVQ